LPGDRGSIFITKRFDRADGQQIPFISAMAITEHDDGDEEGSYFEIVDTVAKRRTCPAGISLNDG